MKLNVLWSPGSRLRAAPSVSVIVRIQNIVTEERASWPRLQTLLTKTMGAPSQDDKPAFVYRIKIARLQYWEFEIWFELQKSLKIALVSTLFAKSIWQPAVLNFFEWSQHSEGSKVRHWLLRTAGAANWHFDMRGHGAGAAAPARCKKWNYQIKWDPISNVVEWTPQYLGQFNISRIYCV